MNKTIKKYALMALFTTTLALPVQAQNWENQYIKAFAGASFLGETTATLDDTPGVEIIGASETGLLIGGAVGGNVSESTRAEIELGYRSYSDGKIESFTGGTAEQVAQVNRDLAGEDTDSSALSLIGNIYFDGEPTGSKVMPFLTAGAGIAQLKNDADDDIVFAYQVGVGVSLEVGENGNLLDIGYRYFGTSDAEFTEGGLTQETSDIDGHEIYVGIRFAINE